MSFVHVENDVKSIAYSASNAAIGSNMEILEEVHRTHINIAIYQKDTDLLQSEIDDLLKEDIEFRSCGPVSSIISDLEEVLLSRNKRLIFKDIAELLRHFEQITQKNDFRVFFATVNSNMCRKFHTDINALRLLCTYAGPGTIWVSDEVANSKEFLNQIDDLDMLPDEGLIERLETGDVAILKGALYPDAFPIMHKSPSLEGANEKRLLLRIDINESLWT